jgi:hypothetical protein
MTKLTVAFRNFANAPKNESLNTYIFMDISVHTFLEISIIFKFSYLNRKFFIGMLWISHVFLFWTSTSVENFIFDTTFGKRKIV